jgi:predicted transcriptional regulator
LEGLAHQMEKERTSVLLEKDIMLKLKALSRSTNKSTTFLIQEAVTEFVAQKTSKQKIGIIGIADSGDPRFAEKDEEFLEKSEFGED